MDRKTVERNRRIHMKDLCFKLTSLIPPHHFKPSKELLSLPDQIDQVTTYIKQLKEKTDRLAARKKAVAMGKDGESHTMWMSHELPMVEVNDLGSCLKVVLISGLKKTMEKNSMLYEVIRVLQDEGAEVLTASFSTLGGKVFHTIHAKVKVSRVGVETSSVRRRLQEILS
ncbi:transcription factor bHLH162-like [Diospyros lotus]|uniref:transcription factor bHLH162-like n=1 Tax=Diospyros lotus TaxID=55363 RepID=UPI00224D8F40|nr:transcription factor bHLH162-like [Diospyros lotus]